MLTHNDCYKQHLCHNFIKMATHIEKTKKFGLCFELKYSQYCVTK